MATARELLEQADALMRRNRLREAAAAGPADDFPMLTDVVATEDHDLPGTPPADALPAANAFGDAAVPAPAPDTGGRGYAAGDVPVLTEVVEDFEPISIIGAPDDTAEAAQWPDFDDGEAAHDEPRPAAGDA